MEERILPPTSWIVGLGNPGEAYAFTRHNVGFIILQTWAKKKGWQFKQQRHLKGAVAKGEEGDRQIKLLLPYTYMNCSGEAVKKALDEDRLSLQEEKALLVVVDDVYLPLGTLRLRPEGSSGGHNGLKSVEASLQSRHYARLRVGVGQENQEELPIALEDYVLGRFTKEEAEKLPPVVEASIAVIEQWINQGISSAMQMAGDLSKKREEI